MKKFIAILMVMMCFMLAACTNGVNNDDISNYRLTSVKELCDYQATLVGSNEYDADGNKSLVDILNKCISDINYAADKQTADSLVAVAKADMDAVKTLKEINEIKAEKLNEYKQNTSQKLNEYADKILASENKNKDDYPNISQVLSAFPDELKDLSSAERIDEKLNAYKAKIARELLDEDKKMLAEYGFYSLEFVYKYELITRADLEQMLRPYMVNENDSTLYPDEPNLDLKLDSAYKVTIKSLYLAYIYTTEYFDDEKDVYYYVRRIKCKGKYNGLYFMNLASGATDSDSIDDVLRIKEIDGIRYRDESFMICCIDSVDSELINRFERIYENKE